MEQESGGGESGPEEQSGKDEERRELYGQEEKRKHSHKGKEEKERNREESGEEEESEDSEEEGVRKEEKEEKEEKEKGEREDWQAWQELVGEGAQEQEEGKEKEDLGGKLMMPKYVKMWDSIGCRKMVEHGCAADWIGSAPTTPQDYTRRERYAGAMHEAMRAVIDEELQRGVLEVIQPQQAAYIMAAFAVVKPKKTRLILDCRPINEYIREKSFKMTDWLHIKEHIRRGYAGSTLDFSNAFHHLGVCEELRRFLNFRYDGICYRYRGLPFGLRSAPRLFCAAMSATMNAIRSRWDVIVSAYMDDVLILAEEADVLRQTVLEIVDFCEALGWTINRKKSVLEPSTRFTYLGLEWDTLAMTIRKTTEKNTALKKTVKQWVRFVRSGATVRVRDLAKLIGQLSATRPQHEEASLYLAKVNRLKCQAVGSDGWEARTTLTRALLPELFWWMRELRANIANDIRTFDPAVRLYTDASETGWGATIRRLNARARWMYGWWTEGEVEVNCLRELNAVVIAVQRAVQKGQIVEDEDVLVFTDNTNVEYNLNRKRAGWRMRAAVKHFVKWLKQKRIRVQCRHVKGELNTTADALSRLSRSGDYRLAGGVLEQIEDALDTTADVDLFATAQNTQCTRYVTVEDVEPDGVTIIARDAMTIPWTGWTALVHPPIPMLARCLAKICRDGTRAILVCPRWRGAPWMHALRAIAVTKPIVLGKAADVLIAGPSMTAPGARASLPPGAMMAVLLQGQGQGQDRLCSNE